MKHVLITLYALAFSAVLFAQEGYDIRVKIDGYAEPEIYLGVFLGDKQYLKDTTIIQPDGSYYFQSKEPIEQGTYLVVLPPDNNYFQVILGDDQIMELSTKSPELSQNMKVKGSVENEVFYDYINFIGSMRQKASPIQEEIKKLQEAGSDTKKQDEQLSNIDAEVRKKQDEIVSKYENSIVAALIKANLPLDEPTFEGDSEDEVRKKRYYWTLDHYFDNIDLADERILRSPFLFQRVNNYTDNMLIQHPDTIAKGVDRILELMRPAEATFKYYLIHFLNKYAASKIVGQDAIYVHIVNKYYSTGQAPWTEEKQLKKIVDNAKTLEPLLIGKTAPNIKMYTKDNTEIELHDFKAKYTILYFWTHDCGHCKKATPKMVEFYEAYKDKGVEVFAICTALWKRDDDGNISLEEVEKCWDYIDENGTGIWLNTVDGYHRSRYKSIYDVKSTPQIYILDENKEILSKRIGAEQLNEVMDRILEMEQQEE